MPLTVCATPGCPTLTPGTHCTDHTAARRRASRTRNPRRSHNYGDAWARTSNRHLAAHPTCQCTDTGCRCGGRGCTRPSTNADHIVARHLFTPPEAGDTPTNLQALCHSCHSSKTARRDGGFGRQPGPTA